LYRAPDLALTQMLIEVASFLLLLFLLSALREREARVPGFSAPTRLGRAGHGLLATGAGAGFALLTALASFETPARKLGLDVLRTTLKLAKGANAVNTILVDYRGYDTLGEITVLVIAALGVRSLREPARARRPVPPRLAENSFVMETIAFVIFGGLNLFAVHLFWRGHQLPGGGFVAGLVTSLSLVWMALARGRTHARRCLPMEPLHLAVTGLLVALGTTALPMLFGQAFFTHSMRGPVGTPLFFDGGVALVVIGVASEILFLALPAPAEETAEEETA
jgi:multicomponent K+:H+ antiporter subunit A